MTAAPHAIPTISREDARRRGWTFTTARRHVEACHVHSLPPQLPLAFPPDDPADWRIVAPPASTGHRPMTESTPARTDTPQDADAEDAFANRIVLGRMNADDARRIVRETAAGRWDPSAELMAEARTLISGDAR